MNTHVSKESVTTSEIAVVPNGSTVITPEVENYVVRYNSFLKKTAEAILGLAQTLLEAKTNLNGVDFNIFCDQVGTTEGSPTYHKLMKIAENAPRLTPFTHKLPNTWTTIYKLAKLPSEQFEQVASNLKPFITAKEIDELAGREREVRTAEPFDLKISFEDLTSEQKSNIYAELNKMKGVIGFKINESMTFKNEMKAYTLSNKSKGGE